MNMAKFTCLSAICVGASMFSQAAVNLYDPTTVQGPLNIALTVTEQMMTDTDPAEPATWDTGSILKGTSATKRKVTKITNASLIAAYVAANPDVLSEPAKAKLVVKRTIPENEDIATGDYTVGIDDDGMWVPYAYTTKDADGNDVPHDITIVTASGVKVGKETHSYTADWLKISESMKKDVQTIATLTIVDTLEVRGLVVGTENYSHNYVGKMDKNDVEVVVSNTVVNDSTLKGAVVGQTDGNPEKANSAAKLGFNVVEGTITIATKAVLQQ